MNDTINDTPENSETPKDKKEAAQHLNLRNEPQVYCPNTLDKLFMDIFLDTDWAMPDDADTHLHQQHTPADKNAKKTISAKNFKDIAVNSGTHHPKIHMSTNGIGSLVLTTKGQNQQTHTSDYSNNAASGAYAKIAHRKIILTGRKDATSFYDAHVFGHPLLNDIRKNFEKVFGTQSLKEFDDGFAAQRAKTTKNYHDFWNAIEKDKYGLGNVPSFILINPQGDDVKVLPLSPFSLLADAQSCKKERWNRFNEEKAQAEKKKKEESAEDNKADTPINETNLTLIGDWMATEHSGKSQNTSLLCNPSRQRLLVLPPKPLKQNLRSLHRMIESKGTSFPMPRNESFGEAMEAYLTAYNRLKEHHNTEGTTYRNQAMKDGLVRAEEWLVQETKDHIESILEQAKTELGKDVSGLIPKNISAWLSKWSPKKQTGIVKQFSREGFGVFLTGALQNVRFETPKTTTQQNEGQIP